MAGVAFDWKENEQEEFKGVLVNWSWTEFLWFKFKIDSVSLFGFDAVLDGIVSGRCVGFCGRIYVTGLSSWRKYSACKQEGSGKIR